MYPVIDEYLIELALAADNGELHDVSITLLTPAGYISGVITHKDMFEDAATTSVRNAGATEPHIRNLQARERTTNYLPKGWLDATAFPNVLVLRNATIQAHGKSVQLDVIRVALATVITFTFEPKPV